MQKLIRLLVSTLLISNLLSSPGFISSAQADNCGWAMIDKDGNSLGVSVGDCEGNFWKDWERLGLLDGVFKNAGCNQPCSYAIQTKADPVTGNVAGWNGESPGTSVKYDSNSGIFTVSQQTTDGTLKPTIAIKDGVATDTTGNSFDTGSGAKVTTTLTPQELISFVISGNNLPDKYIENLSNDNLNKIANEANQKLKENITSLVQNAIIKAIEAAKKTPGIERCISWAGYGNSGTECKTFVNGVDISISSGSTTSETHTAISDSNSSTETSTSQKVTPGEIKNVLEKLQDKSSITVNAISTKTSINELKGLINNVVENQTEATALNKIADKLTSVRGVTYSKSTGLPNLNNVEEAAVSLTPLVCVIEGNTVVSLKKGTCNIEFSVKGASGNEFTVGKTIVFRK